MKSSQKEKKKMSKEKAKHSVSYIHKSRLKKVAQGLPAYHLSTKATLASRLLEINYEKTCECEGNKINCLTAKEWLKNQLEVWEFFYEKRDVRDKEFDPSVHPVLAI